MFDYSLQERQDIDTALEPKLAWAAHRKIETQQLALDATRLLSCTGERLDVVKSHGFFKRCWFTLSGKRSELQFATQQDLLEMQKIAWRYIGLLQERDLMLAHSMMTVRNNLLTLQADNQEMRSQLRVMADAIYDRFLALEERMKKLEAASAIHGWLITIDTQDYPYRYTPMLRMLAVIRDFRSHKVGDWNFQELRYLQQAIKQVELPWKELFSVTAIPRT